MNHGTTVAFGIILVTGGLTIAIGSVSGNLGPMLAGLFDPTDLTLGSNQTSKKKSKLSLGNIVPGAIQSIISQGVPGLIPKL